jgi:hypothetical protein
MDEVFLIVLDGVGGFDAVEAAVPVAQSGEAAGGK